MSSNLICLIESCSSLQSKTAEIFLTEEDVMDVLKGKNNIIQMESSTNQDENNQKFYFQQPVAVVWDEATGAKKWYIGFVVSELSGSTVLIDHLERKSEGCDNTWQRTPVDDVQTTEIVQIIPCPVVGEWTFSSRIPSFKVQNSEEISHSFDSMWSQSC